MGVCGWQWWLAGCMVNQWGGIVSTGRGECDMGKITQLSSSHTPSPVHHPSPPVVLQERVGESGRGWGGLCGLFKHFFRLSGACPIVPIWCFIYVHRIIANQCTNKTAPKNTHNPQKLGAYFGQSQGTKVSTTHQSLLLYRNTMILLIALYPY